MDMAIQFNNCGVQLLNEECYNDAFYMFQGSMGVLAQLSRQHARHQPLHLVEEAECVELAKTHLDKNTSRNRNRNRKRSAHSIPPFVYSKPIAIEPTTTSCLDKKFYQGNHDDKTEVFQRYSAIAMFNFALTHHLKFFDGPSTQESFLHRALKLYRLSFDLITENLSDGREEQSVDYTVVIAILNNKAQVYHELGNYVDSESHLDTLTQVVMSLDENVHQQSLLADGDIFLLNATLLREPTTAPAA